MYQNSTLRCLHFDNTGERGVVIEEGGRRDEGQEERVEVGNERGRERGKGSYPVSKPRRGPVLLLHTDTRIKNRSNPVSDNVSTLGLLFVQETLLLSTTKCNDLLLQCIYLSPYSFLFRMSQPTLTSITTVEYHKFYLSIFILHERIHMYT